VGELKGKRVVLRPTTEADAEELRHILETTEVATWWGRVPEGFPLGDDPDATRFTVLAEGRIAGLIQFGEESDPDYRHAWIDLYVDPALQNRGLGTDAIETLVPHLLDERGHHRITIDPATDNAAAIRCYEKAGFRPVGVMRSAWRDSWSGEWRDTLLMELVAADRR